MSTISLLAEIDRIIEEHPRSGDHAEDGRHCLRERTAALYALAEKYDLIQKANWTECRCGWLHERGGQCRNPVHKTGVFASESEPNNTALLRQADKGDMPCG